MNESHPLKKTTTKILEDWGMMLVEDADADAVDFGGESPLYSSEVEMRGTFHGTLSVFAQEPFLATLAANILGNDAPSEDDKLDAFKELGNILAGNFLTEAYGADLVFDVTQPRVSETNGEQLEKLEGQRVRFYFLADDAPVAVTFSITEAA